MITHRLTSAREADEIVLLQEGCIVERGEYSSFSSAQALSFLGAH